MFTTLPDSEIDSFLHKQIIGRIGCHESGKTYVVPISYIYDGSAVYGHTEEGMKIRMMRANPFVCFEVDSLQNLGNWKSVICQGFYRELTEENERTAALNLLYSRKLPYLMSNTTKLAKEWPFRPENVNDIEGVVFKILIESKSGKRETNSVDSFVAWG